MLVGVGVVIAGLGATGIGDLCLKVVAGSCFCGSEALVPQEQANRFLARTSFLVTKLTPVTDAGKKATED